MFERSAMASRWVSEGPCLLAEFPGSLMEKRSLCLIWKILRRRGSL